MESQTKHKRKPNRAELKKAYERKLISRKKYAYLLLKLEEQPKEKLPSQLDHSASRPSAHTDLHEENHAGNQHVQAI